MNKTNTRAMKNIDLLKAFILASCLLFSNLAAAQCSNDTIPPICIAPSDTTMTLAEWNALGISYTNLPAMQAIFGTPFISDNCPGVFLDELPPDHITSNQCSGEEIVRYFRAVDLAGNFSSIVRQVIELTFDYAPTYTISVPGDFMPGDTVEQLIKIDSVANGIVANTFNDILFDFDCDNIIDRTVRQWTVLDWCSGGPEIELPRLDMNNDGTVGDAYDITHIGDSVFVIDAAGAPIMVLGPKSGLFLYTQLLNHTGQNSLNTITVTGSLFSDTDGNCALDAGENGLALWNFEIVGQASGNAYLVKTDSMGNYSIALCAYDTIFDIRMAIPMNYVGACASEYTQQFPNGASSMTVDIPVALEGGCPLLEVDISLPLIRRCFDNRAYINYCNYSIDTIFDAYVEVTLDSFMTVLTPSIPGSFLGDVWTFDLGDLAPGECGNFNILYNLDCSAELGQAHCVMAHIYPDSLCEPAGANWSGASVEVDALCDGDSIRLSIINTGLGDMSAPLNYIVVEDVLMHSDGDFQLNSGNVMRIPLEANGSTWFLSADQEPGHPGVNLPSVVVEGCGGNNSPGLATAFVHNDANPFISIECRHNQGSYDPNDKQVSPTGIGDDHLVPANTQLDYLIRFQNTGTDTAFTVVIVDTLSAHLDAGSIIPGASSHPYTFEYAEDRVVRFTFNNIMLPDSNVNEAASNGFVKFKIQQQADNPDDTRIENSAAIYFDFNEPVITNNTFVTIGENIFEVVNAAQEVHLPGVLAKVYPNPVREQITFELEGLSLSEGELLIYDQLGKLIATKQIGHSKFDYDCTDLVPGAYWYRVSAANELILTGKLIVY